MSLLIVNGINFSHFRLVELAQLADQAKPFYDWVEKQFQIELDTLSTLDECLQTATHSMIQRGIQRCYEAETDQPLLFDGVGRTYQHQKACFYFFAWLIRDAPQQRLSPLIMRRIKKTQEKRVFVEVDVISRLIVEYRTVVQNFSWVAIREIIIDRLEGSRRSLKGHEKEAIIRTALVYAFQKYFAQHQNYGNYSHVEIPKHQIKIGNESFDVSVMLSNENKQTQILIPIKTRETEGGGHAHLFSRDILSAIQQAKTDANYIIVIIIAQNWSDQEKSNLEQYVDALIHVNQSPTQFEKFDMTQQDQLNELIAHILEME